ncbi:MAG: Gfo/Idh/MocA family oxidoreductase [Candidatus Omnitrophota bacterium]
MKHYKAGIIGCGTIFPMHARSLLKIQGVTIAAVCDIKRKRAAERAKEYRSSYYTDYKKMFREERLDCVHICTPHHLHAQMALAAADYGMNALVEKPMALNSEDAARMIDSFKKKKLKLGVISQNRFNPSSRLVRQCFTAGKLGKFKAAKLVLTYHKPDAYYQKSDWKGTWSKEGGGVVIDQSIHYLDVLRWLADDDVEYVEANIANRMHNFIKVEDCAEGVIKFKKGAYVCFYLINFYSYDADTQFEIHCEKGRARVVKDSGVVEFASGKNLIAKPRKNEYIDYGKGVRTYWGYCHYNQIKDYYDSLKANREPAITGVDGKKTLDIVLAIYESSERKKRIYFK